MFKPLIVSNNGSGCIKLRTGSIKIFHFNIISVITKKHNNKTMEEM